MVTALAGVLAPTAWSVVIMCWSLSGDQEQVMQGATPTHWHTLHCKDEMLCVVCTNQKYLTRIAINLYD